MNKRSNIVGAVVLALIPLFFTLLASCSKKEKAGSTKYNPPVANLITAIDFQENLTPIGDITDIAFSGDTAVFVLSDNKIIHYNWQGEQVAVIERRSAGPEEYISARYIVIDNGALYVWCSSTARLLEYDLEGNFVRLLADPKYAIKQFFVNKEKDEVIFYNPHGAACIAGSYDTKNGGTTTYDAENFDETDILVTVGIQLSGVICDKDAEVLLFAPPSTQEVKRLDLTNGSFELENAGPNDQAFKVSEIKNAGDYINGFGQKGFNYIFSNSVTIGVYQGSKGLIMVSLIGKQEFDWQTETFRTGGNRAYRYYFQDANAPSGWIAKEQPFTITSTNVFKAHKGKLYTIQYNEDANGNFSTTLCQVE